MKKKLLFLFLLSILSFNFFNVSIFAQEVDTLSQPDNYIEINTDINTYIEEKSDEATMRTRSGDKEQAFEDLNSIVKDSSGIFHYLSAEPIDGGELSITDVYADPTSMARSISSTVTQKIYVSFYVTGLVPDYVGKIHFTAKRTYHDTSTSSTCGQRYYEWSSASNYTYDKRENGFTISNFKKSYKNYTTSGNKSYVQATITWDTNKSYVRTGSIKYYAPRNP